MMKYSETLALLDRCDAIVNRLQDAGESKDKKVLLPNDGKVKVRSRAQHYHQTGGRSLARYPEYDLNRIAVAEHGEPYVMRAAVKKTNRILVAGWSFVGNNEEAVHYITMRIKHMEYASELTWLQRMQYLFKDMFTYNNHMWVGVRSNKKSAGDFITTNTGAELAPIAAFFPIPFETLKLRNRENGDLVEIKQRVPGAAADKTFSAKNCVHFWSNRRVGFSIGTPELLPTLDDISLLRHLEDLVQELIETNLFPIYHIKVGTENARVRVGADGLDEVSRVQRTIQYMPPGSMYITDWRQEVNAISADGQIVDMAFYLDYFKQRVIAGVGLTPMDLGDGSGTTRSNADSMSKNMLLDIEAMARIVEDTINFKVIMPMLIEGGFNPLEDLNDEVRMQFGVIDREERRAEEQHVSDLYNKNIFDLDEARQRINSRPWEDSQFERTHQYLFKSADTLTAAVNDVVAAEALAVHPVSPLNAPELTRARSREDKVSEAAKPPPVAGASGSTSGVKPKPKPANGARQGASKTRPSNQHGTRSTTKTTHDADLVKFFNDSGGNPDQAEDYLSYVHRRHDLLDGETDLFAIARSVMWRFNKE